MSLLTRLAQWHRLNKATEKALRPHEGFYNGETNLVPGYPKWTKLLEQGRR